MGFGHKIVLILLILCFIIDLIGFAIAYWFSMDNSGVKTYLGLWNYCIESEGVKACDNVNRINLSELNWFSAVRAFSILSWVFFLLALVLVIIFMSCMSERRVLYLVAVCLSFVGAICAMIAFAVYAGKWELKEYSAGFALTIVAFILGLIIGIFGILDYFGVFGGK